MDPSPAKTSWPEIRAQLSTDRAQGVQRVNADLLRGMRAADGWAAFTHGNYSPSLQYDRTWIFGQVRGTSPNPFRASPAPSLRALNARAIKVLHHGNI